MKPPCEVYDGGSSAAVDGVYTVISHGHGERIAHFNHDLPGFVSRRWDTLHSPDKPLRAMLCSLARH